MYLDAGIGFDEPNNSKLENLVSFLRSFKLPFATGGDFNIEPAEWHKNIWLNLLDARIITPDNVEYTCFASADGTLLDYYIVSNCIAPFFVNPRALMDTPWERILASVYT